MDATDAYLATLCYLLADHLEHLDDLRDRDRGWVCRAAAELLELIAEGIVGGEACAG